MLWQLLGLAKESFIYGVGNFLNRLLPLLILPLLTRYLSPKEFGVIALLGVVGLWVRSIFGLGLGVSTGIVYFQDEGIRHRQATISTSFVVLAISVCALLLAIGLFAGDFSSLVFGNRDLDFVLFLYAGSIGLQLLAQPFLAEWQFKNEAMRFVLLSTLGASLTVVAMVVLVIGAHRGIRGWVEGGLIGNLALLVACLLVVGLSSPRSFDTKLGKHLIQLGLPLIPSFLFLFVIQYAGTYLLQGFVSLDQVGIYGVGFSLGMALGLATSSFTTAWYPFFQSYMTKPNEAQPIFSHVLTGYTLGMGALCLLFFLLAKPGVFLLTEARYHSAYRVVGLVALGQFWLGMWAVLLPGMYFAKETKYVAFVQGIVALLVVALNLVFIPAFGIEGAALAFAVGGMMMVGLQQLVNTVRRYQVSNYTWSRTGRLAGILLGLISCSLFASRTLPMKVELLVGMVMFGAYVWCGWLLLSDEEKAAASAWAKQRLDG